ncbi:MAG: hypothetical protein E7583_08360 [Ruminococcaceae bacterium]|nr:hypothetical protein [Oscillospiraceae bacterium]
MKLKIKVIILPVITLVLQVLPFGAVCNFASPDGDSIRKTFSYFSPVPFGYANFSPLLTGIFTVFTFGTLLIYLFFKRRRSLIYAEFLTWISFGLSLCPLWYGIRFFSVTGFFITITLLVKAIIIHTILSKKEN